MRKFVVFVVAILAIFSSLNVAAQNNAATKDISMMPPSEINGVFIVRAENELADIKSKISNSVNKTATKKLWAERIALEKNLEARQVICPQDSVYYVDRKDLKEGVVKNYNLGENEIANIYIVNTGVSLKPVVLTLRPGQEVPLSLPMGSYKIIITCLFYNKVFMARICKSNWLISSTLSASVI